MAFWDRVAIVGTAQSWSMVPWQDRSLTILGLNDAYRLEGFQRADVWFDLHPLDHLWLAPEGARVFAHEVPVGRYVRPAGYLDWLAAQRMPIYLHPDHAQQYPAAATWPMARAFPKATLEVHYGTYFTSSPAWMMALALAEGCRHLEIYGIHLATEHEYIEQRPQFEMLIGRMLGPGKMTVTTSQGMRRYETADGVVLLPEMSPVLQSPYQYAFEPRPRAALEPLKWEAHKVAIKTQRAIHHLKTAPWWRRRRAVQEELWRLEAWQADVQDRMARIQRGA